MRRENIQTQYISLDWEAIENVLKYRYLGSKIKNDESNTGQTELELKTDVEQMQILFSLHKHLQNEYKYKNQNKNNKLIGT